MEWVNFFGRYPWAEDISVLRMVGTFTTSEVNFVLPCSVATTEMVVMLDLAGRNSAWCYA